MTYQKIKPTSLYILTSGECLAKGIEIPADAQYLGLVDCDDGETVPMAFVSRRLLHQFIEHTGATPHYSRAAAAH